CVRRRRGWRRCGWRRTISSTARTGSARGRGRWRRWRRRCCGRTRGISGGIDVWSAGMTAATLPDLIADAQTTEEQFLRHVFVRDQMAEWSKAPLVMSKADGVFYWDVSGKRYLDALSG